MSYTVDTKTGICANRSYYLETGMGDWAGAFTFQITDWKGFRKDKIGIKNRFLVLMMALLSGVFGKSSITSRLEKGPDESGRSVATNEVRIKKFGLTLYLLLERYILHPDCRQVLVQSKERFGPLSFLFNVEKEHPAEVLEEGRHAIYYMPLLGTDWVGSYKVREDSNHIDSILTCPWAEATEKIDRVR